MDKALEKLATADDVEARRKAALALGEVPAEEALPLLEKLLGDNNWRVRKAAVESMLFLPMHKSLPVLFEALKDPENAGRRNSGVETLTKLGPSILPYIYDNLVEEDLDVKLSLIELLGKLPSKASAPHLIYYLGHENKNIVSCAITSLGELKDTGNLPILLDVFHRQDDWLWFHLIEALSNIGGPVAIDKLSELYHMPRFRKAVLKAFGHLSSLEALPFLLQVASEPDAPLTDIFEAIGRMYHANIPEVLLSKHRSEMGKIVRANFPMELLSRLEELWTDAKLEVRRGLIVVSGFLGDLSLLDSVLNDMENPYLQRDALEAVVAFGKPASEAIVRRLNESTDTEQKMVLIRLLGVTGGEDSVVPLLNQAKEEDIQVRMEAIAALGEVADPRCLKELISILREDDDLFHETALRAVAKLSGKTPALGGKMVAYAEEMILEEQAGVRRAGYTLLAQALGGEVTKLLPGLRDSSPEVRGTVIRLVADCGGPDAFDKLLPMLGDKNPKVRRAAISVLGRELLVRQPETLMASLSDVDTWVRAETAFFLAQSTAEEVAAALMEILEEDELPVRLGALKGLAQVGCGVLYSKVLAMAENEENPTEIRSASLAAIAHAGRPEASKVIENALRDRNWELRAAAIELLGSSGDHGVLPILLRELERETNTVVKQSIVEALVALKATEAVPRMLNYLSDPELQDQAYSFFLSLGKGSIPLIENEAQSVDFQTKLILIDILKQLESR